jgi:hypothetical protein
MAARRGGAEKSFEPPDSFSGDAASAGHRLSSPYVSVVDSRLNGALHEFWALRRHLDSINSPW